jgi:crossover junction endodeoxyribonuclease RuvC
MRVIGIDPGIERLGYAIIDYNKSEYKLISMGLVKTDKAERKSKRIYQIYNDLKSLISNYKPEILSLETLIFSKNAKTATTISEVRGIILLLSEESRLILKEFTPLQVKMQISGYGKADKKQIAQSVKMLLHLNEIPKPDDITDAIAIALCGIE